MYVNPMNLLKSVGLPLLCVGLVAGSLTVPSRAASDNVVIIHVDDLGWRDLGCMGSPVYETPHIDALAKSGTLFTSAYAASGICTPARACMLTGSQPMRHGIYTVVKNRGKKENWKVLPTKNVQYLPKEYPTIGHLLTGAGIKNGVIGKWHVFPKTPSHGFDEGKWGGYLGMPINYFAPFKLGFLPKDVPDGSYLPEYVRKAGLDFLERHQKERFFLYFSTYLPHDEIKNEDEDSKLSAPPKVVKKYERKMAKMKKAGKGLEGHNNPVYAAMIEETDRSVGAVIDKLDELGLREKTLVLFISDNGGVNSYTSQLPLRGGKTQLYEGGIRVPMIASMPGKVASGKVSDEPVSGMDFYPTICTVMGLTPADPSKVDGEDLSPLIFEGKSLGDRNLFWDFPCYSGYGGAQSTPRMVLRRNNWKIHFNFEENNYELYNLNDDIGETKNLVEAEPEVFAKMRKHLNDTCERFGAEKTLPPNPDYDAASTKVVRAELTQDVLTPNVSIAKAYEMMGLSK